MVCAFTFMFMKIHRVTLYVFSGDPDFNVNQAARVRGDELLNRARLEYNARREPDLSQTWNGKLSSS